MDSTLKIALSMTNNSSIYVLCDDTSFYDKKLKRYGSKMKYLIDEETELDRYGLSNVYPSLFHIKENTLFDYIKLLR